MALNAKKKGKKNEVAYRQTGQQKKKICNNIPKGD